MGRATEEFVKYPKTPHLWGSKLADEDKMLSEMDSEILLATKNVDFVWESKLDGTNVGISFADGELKIQNRGHILTTGEHPQYNVFRSWAGTFVDKIREVLGGRYIMFGEWCYAVHTIKYRSLLHWFNEFDIWDKQEKKFLSTPLRKAMLEPLVKGGILAQVPVVWPEKTLGYGDSGKLTLAQARKLMVSYGPIYGEDKPEGLYLKVEKKGEVIDRYKMVRDEFIQHIIDGDTHWKEKPPEIQGLAEDVNIFNPKPRIEIILNGKKTIVREWEMFYEDIVMLAYGKPFFSMSMTYSRGCPEKPEGIVHASQILAMKEGMIIDVMDTSLA